MSEDVKPPEESGSVASHCYRVMLKLFEITTHSVGESYVRSYAWCSNEKQALREFRERFPNHEVLQCSILFSSQDDEFITEPSDSGFTIKRKITVSTDEAFRQERIAGKEANELRTKLHELQEEVASVVQLMDDLAEQWGDEAVFRRCRDRLRESIRSR